MNIKLSDVYTAAHTRAARGECEAAIVAASLAPKWGNSQTILSRFVDLYPDLMEKHGHCERVKLLMQEMLEILIEAYTYEAAQAIYDVRNKINRGNV